MRIPGSDAEAYIEAVQVLKNAGVYRGCYNDKRAHGRSIKMWDRTWYETLTEMQREHLTTLADKVSTTVDGVRLTFKF